MTHLPRSEAPNRFVALARGVEDLHRPLAVRLEHTREQHVHVRGREAAVRAPCVLGGHLLRARHVQLPNAAQHRVPERFGRQHRVAVADLHLARALKALLCECPEPDVDVHGSCAQSVLHSATRVTASLRDVLRLHEQQCNVFRERFVMEVARELALQPQREFCERSRCFVKVPGRRQLLAEPPTTPVRQ